MGTRGIFIGLVLFSSAFLLIGYKENNLTAFDLSSICNQVALMVLVYKFWKEIEDEGNK